MDGKIASAKLLGPFNEPNTSSLSVWTQPNSWHHFCCDHVVTFSLMPMSPDRTLVRTSWLVHEDAVEGVDYDIDNLTAVWRATNLQDATGRRSTIAASAATAIGQALIRPRRSWSSFKSFLLSRASQRWRA